jgi:Domain of unknown function (DUF4062)
MAKTVSELSVFVASPTDVPEEREALEEVISELNNLWGSAKSIRLVLVRWETHAYPSVGIDAQAVINEQIGDAYDIFIGILFTRFGSPTGRAESGTEEEFSRAYERYKRCPNELRILFYFKDAEVKLSEIDLDQLGRVRNFKNEIGELGTLHWQYKDKDEFRRLLHLHLTRHVDDWGKKWGVGEVVSSRHSTPQTGAQVEIQRTMDEEESEEEGLLDLLEIGDESVHIFGETMGRLTVAVSTLGERFQKREVEIATLKTEGGENNARNFNIFKRICNHSADDLQQFSKLIDAELPMFSENFGKMVDAYSKAATIMQDFSEGGEDLLESVESAKTTLSSLKESINSSQISTMAFRENIAAQPRLTTNLNRARRRAVKSIDSLIGEMQTACNLAEESEKMFEALGQELFISKSSN